MASCRHHVDHALWKTIPLLDELFDPVQWAVCAAPQEYHPHHALAGTGLVTHKLHSIPIAIVGQRKVGQIKSVGPSGNVLPMPEIDGVPSDRAGYSIPAPVSSDLSWLLHFSLCTHSIHTGNAQLQTGGKRSIPAVWPGYPQLIPTLFTEGTTPQTSQYSQKASATFLSLKNLEDRKADTSHPPTCKGAKKEVR